MWRGPCAALHKAAYSSKLREHPVLPLGSAHPLRLVGGRAAARLLRGQGGEATPQRRSVRWLHAGAALCCLVGSMLVLCAVFARRLAESCSIRTGAGDATLESRPLWFSPSSLPSPHLRPHLRRPRLLEMSTSLSHRESAQPSLAVTAANDVGSTSAAHAATGPSPSSSRPRPPQRSPPQCNARMVVLGKGCRRVLTTGRAQFMSAI